MDAILVPREREAVESKHSPRFASRVSRRIGMGTRNVIERLGRDEHATASLAGIGGMALGIAAVIIGAVVALVILSNLFPTYSGAVGSISENVSTADWGDPVANGLGPVFAMLVSLGGLFAIIALVFVAYKLRKSSG